MRILAIIPAYNEEDNIPVLLQEILNLKHLDIDIVVINDCSTDNTANVCKEMGVKVINLPCNLGIGGAVQTGYKYAFANKYDIAIQIDGDGQHKPEYINDLLKPLLYENIDMVIGSRYIKRQGFQSTAIRRVGIKYFSKLISALTKQKITDPTSGFRACNLRVIELFSKRYPQDYPEPESIVFLNRNNFKIKEVPVIMKERGGGVSSISPLKSIYYMVKVSLAIMIDVLRKEIA